MAGLGELARKKIPPGVRRALKRSPLLVRRRAASVNLYHCCVHKTASQWLRALLSDRRVFRYCGLEPYSYEAHLPGGADLRPLTERRFAAPFPERTIVSPLYVDFEGFASLPKPARYRAFFVPRDPRDLVVSMYFSWRYSHPPMGEIPRLRAELEGMDEQAGYRYTAETMAAAGEFDALASWAQAGERDPNVRIFSYEELTGPQGATALQQLFAHLGIELPARTFAALVADHAFERVAGRPRGEEDPRAHNRAGVAGDWRRRFDAGTAAHVEQVTGGLAAALGYAP